MGRLVHTSLGSRNLQYADAMFANFLSRTQGTWTPAAGHTWKNRAGKAAKLDHVVTWNISTSTPPATRWTDSPGQGVLGCEGMKYDHAQLLISLDRSILPTPPPAHLTIRRPQPERFDHVLFPSLVDKWRQIVDNLIASEPRVGSSSYWPVYKFFASQSLHNRKNFKKKIRQCK